MSASRSTILQEIQRAVDSHEIDTIWIPDAVGGDRQGCRTAIGPGKYCPHIAVFYVTKRNGEPCCLTHVLDVLRNGAVRRQKGR